LIVADLQLSNRPYHAFQTFRKQTFILFLYSNEHIQLLGPLDEHLQLKCETMLNADEQEERASYALYDAVNESRLNPT
jgi:hypothetical protein